MAGRPCLPPEDKPQARPGRVSVGQRQGIGTFAASVSSLSIPAGGSASVTVSFTSVKGAPTGPSQAVLHVGSEHAALYAMIK